MKPFFAALQFLTIIPVSGKLAGGAEELKGSVPYFPLVGFLIGLAAAGVDRIFFVHLPPLPAGVLIVMFLVGISGGFHLDGLADTADGFLSARPREKTLEIMRDSRTGVMGTIAVVFVILFKVAVLEPIPFDQRWKVVLLMPFAGRIAVVLMMAFLPYVRTAGGIATLFQGKAFPPSCPLGGVIFLSRLVVDGRLGRFCPGVVARRGGGVICGLLLPQDRGFHGGYARGRLRVDRSRTAPGRGRLDVGAFLRWHKNKKGWVNESRRTSCSERLFSRFFCCPGYSRP